MREMTTLVTTVPSGDDDGAGRLRQIGDRDSDLQQLGRGRWVLHSTHAVVGEARVTFVDTLTRSTLDD